MKFSKNSIDDFAVFGGTPAFNRTLHIGRPNLGDKSAFIKRIEGILDSRWLSNNGPQVQQFEKRIAEYIAVRHCIAVCNATVGLEVAARALGLTGEVIVPSFTFVATPHSLQWQEITPVFCDIDPETHLIDPSKVEQLITPRTTGLLGVHLWGRACNIDALSDIARRHHLKLFFDAAHAFGCSYRGEKIGRFGDAEVFSFHATKFLNSGEGGAIVTNDDELAKRIRLMINFGFSGIDKVIHLGTNGKMCELSAAMGLTNLENIDHFIKVNRENHRHYLDSLRGIPGLKMVQFDEREACNYQYIVLQVDHSVTGISRDNVTIILWAENVLARRYFCPPCHQMEPYRSSFPMAGLQLKLTESLSNCIMTLPTGTDISTDDIDAICSIVKLSIRYGAEISERLYAKTYKIAA